MRILGMRKDRRGPRFNIRQALWLLGRATPHPTLCDVDSPTALSHTARLYEYDYHHPYRVAHTDSRVRPTLRLAKGFFIPGRAS